MLCEALDAAGLENYRVGLGDASLYPALLEALGVDAEPRERILTELVDGDFVGRRARGRATSALDRADAELLLRVPQIRGGPEVLEDLDGPLDDAVTGMRAVHALLAPSVAERMIFDLGLVRSLGYYTGAVFQVYDPAYGVPIGSGGRYDELLGQFGRPLPAVGFALNVERLHIALTGEERGRCAMTTSCGSPSRAARCSTRRSTCSTGSASTPREVRENDRKLLFEDAGIITMRPSDVPTYVEAGAADLGITGKDVLMEQSEREVYELVDLGYGALHDGAGDESPARTARPRRCAASASCGSRPSTRGSPPATSSRPAARRRSSRSRARSSWRR